MKVKDIFALGVGIATLAFSLVVNAGTASWSTESKGGFSQVHMYEPTVQSPIGNGKSLLIVLHGCTQSFDAFRTANLEEAADQYGMVIAVPNAQYKAGYNCWSYWEGAISRTSADYKNVITLAQDLRDDSAYDIDPAQIYVAGLSSGGAFAMTVGCLAPDIFAGMGLLAAPSAGSSADGSFDIEPGPIDVAARCQGYAGSYASHFDTQITNTAYGTEDYTVPREYGRQNAAAMAIIYDVSQESVTSSTHGASNIVETMWTAGRVSMLEMGGVGHAWPGGTGASGTYIDGSSINYGVYLAQYFAENNARVIQPCYCQTIIHAAVDAPLGGTTATVTATIEVPAASTLKSIVVSVDAESRTVSGTSISEVFTIDQGVHTATIEVTVTGNDGIDYLTVETIDFDNTDWQVCALEAGETATVIAHYNAGRLTTQQYIDLGATYGYNTVITLYRLADGTWTDVNDCVTECDTDSVSATVTDHYVAGRIDVTTYNVMGAQYGYNTTITLYNVGGVWTETSDCQ